MTKNTSKPHHRPYMREGYRATCLGGRKDGWCGGRSDGSQIHTHTQPQHTCCEALLDL